MTIMMMGFWVLAIGLIVWGVASLRPGRQPPAPDETPLEILKRRYANGDISQEEHERILATL